jgi:hypothetical protein
VAQQVKATAAAAALSGANPASTGAPPLSSLVRLPLFGQADAVAALASTSFNAAAPLPPGHELRRSRGRYRLSHALLAVPRNQLEALLGLERGCLTASAAAAAAATPAEDQPQQQLPQGGAPAGGAPTLAGGAPPESPLLQFRSHRLAPTFAAVARAGAMSPTYCHALDPLWPLCVHEQRGSCRVAACGCQHWADGQLLAGEAAREVAELLRRKGVDQPDAVVARLRAAQSAIGAIVGPDAGGAGAAPAAHPPAGLFQVAGAEPQPSGPCSPLRAARPQRRPRGRARSSARPTPRRCASSGGAPSRPPAG